MMHRSSLLFLTVVAMLLAARAQSPPPVSAEGGFSQEAAVIEEMSTKIVFENDGNFTREQMSRVRIQTDGGVKQWGLLNFPFESATQTVEIDYVRVRKLDGSSITTPPDNVQDLDAEITRSAPFYSDLREKHVAVKGLGKGDVLEYAAHWRTTKPLIPGQFWFQYRFQHEGVVLEERVEVKVPSERPVKFKGPAATQAVTTEARFRVYDWTFSQRQSNKTADSDQKNRKESEGGMFPPPDVQISSFQTWDEVGRWYWNLQKERIEPTSAIRVKAAELTRGMTDDSAKLRAIYSFVSTQYRYVGIAFGIGRYQPHAAEDVLTNSYGDCKDKHTLLASLLQASGITIYPALINSSWKLDPDVPSPAQFDHIIGYLPGEYKNKEKDKDALWLDTTPEVAPLGYLVPRLREKQALVLSGDKPIQLVSTPADSPFPTSEVFKVEGKLSLDGTFEAKIEDTTRGDSEVMIRAAFRQVPQPQWGDLVQRISYGLGFAGTVSDISAGTPETTNEPFHFSYSYRRKDYPDWSNRQFTVPGLPFGMPPANEGAKDALWLGSPMETVAESKVELPKGYKAQVPLNVDLNYDFAEYHASYYSAADQSVLIAKRRMLIKRHEVPVAQFEEYRNFLKSLQNDVYQYVQTSSSSSSVLIPPLPGKALSLLNALRVLPQSNSSEANELEAEAREEMLRQDLQGAVSSLYRAVSADPKFTRAWVTLGQLLLAQKQIAAGVDAFQKAIASDPEQSAIPMTLGFGLMANGRFEDAVPVWQDFIKAHPSDGDGPTNLGSCLAHLKRYAEAAAAYEAALKIRGDNARMQASLGSAYLHAQEREKAGAAFAKLAELNADEDIFNDVAYEMANEDLKLPLALDYAKKAVRVAEEASGKITLTDLKIEDLKKIFKVAAYWDTIGWVDERMSSLGEAETFLQASWKLTQDGVVAGHLCHLYRREHKDVLAVQMCRIAIYRMSMSNEVASDQYQTELNAAQENLKHLTGDARPKKDDASDVVIHEREFKLQRFLPGTESAEFFVLFGSDAKSKMFKVEDVKFISGSDKMKLEGKQLKTIDFKVPAPDDVPTRFVRRGILGCYQYSGCSFVLLDPAAVHSLN
jgi:tetratricopeptide (TPR) repeat protein